MILFAHVARRNNVIIRQDVIFAAPCRFLRNCECELRDTPARCGDVEVLEHGDARSAIARRVAYASYRLKRRVRKLILVPVEEVHILLPLLVAQNVLRDVADVVVRELEVAHANLLAVAHVIDDLAVLFDHDDLANGAVAQLARFTHENGKVLPVFVM